ncbi:MAG TPA: FAD-dependent oxidoreductase [Ktedonosporobacter sp.]|nr:FAD-dependent oxidoreductase [Ktedonosporobacter sp.]
MAERISYLIIGNGIAGVTAAEILRSEDSAATIAVIADDPFPVYYRPALKDYLAGRVREDKLWARPQSFYEDHTIYFLPDRVVGIQAGVHTVQLKSGREVGYQRLLLANGASPARLKCPGTNLAGVCTLRTVADYQDVLKRLSTVRRVVVSGSGTLALETIETLRHRGYEVTHLIRRRTLWSEVLDATASDLVLQQERRDGVDVHVEEEIAEITGKDEQVNGVVTTKGTRIACEMVIIAIGVEPNIDFIKASGISCGRGVQVDTHMRTSAPDIYAAGDVLETSDARTGRVRIIGQWYPSIQQARAAAYSMLNLLDNDRPFNSNTFYNATFLYGLEFASVGLTNPSGYQEIVADPRPRVYRKALLKDGVPVGMLSLGDRKHALAFKRAIDHRVNLSPIAKRLFDQDFKLNDWLDAQKVPAARLGVSREGDSEVTKAAYAGGSTVMATMVHPQPLSEGVLVQVADRVSGLHLPEVRLSQTKVIAVGREIGVHLLIDQGSVSRRHSEISYANSQYVLHDLGSTNGTHVNDVRLTPGSAYILKQDDVIRFGNVVKFKFLLRPIGAQAGGQVKQTSLVGISLAGITSLHGAAEQLAPASLGQSVLNDDGSLLLPGASQPIPASVVATFRAAPALVVLAARTSGLGSGVPQVVLLKQGRRMTIGRDKGNEIALADVVLSRRHAEVFPGPDGFYVRDLGSSNGVRVNQTKIGNPYLLAHGDRIEIGSSMLYFIDLQSRLRETDYAAAQPPRAKELVGVAATPGSSASAAYAPTILAGAAPGGRSPTPAPHVITCRNCGVVNTQVARFCAGCSAPLLQSQTDPGKR